MNKKAAVFHWIIFGILAGLAILLFFSKITNVGVEIKGKWQTDFLKDNYLEAERIMLENEIIAKNIASEIALDLAKNGGFPPGTDSSCGTIEDVTLWYKNKEWCLPDVATAVSDLSEQEFTQRLSQKKFSNFSYKGNYFVGTGDMQTISSDVGSYVFDTSFAIDMGYSFEEYTLLKDQALGLITLCTGKDLAECVQKTKPENWKYGSCDSPSDSFPADTTAVIFCVDNPNLGAVDVGDGLIQEKKLIKYEFGLDFG